MAEAPYQADARGGAEPALIAQNSSNGNDMVRVGRVPHPEDKAKQGKAQRRGVTRKHQVTRKVEQPGNHVTGYYAYCRTDVRRQFSI
jgi:hypothetical protein